MRYSLGVALLLSFFLSVPITFAQTPTNSLREQKNQLKQEFKQSAKDARSEFKTKLNEIKDTQKQKIVERIDTRIQQTNASKTTQMTNTLTRLTAILDSFSQKSPSPNTQTLIDTARNKIDISQTAITTQKNKEYVIDITTESSLGQAVRTLLQTFSKDIKAAHKTVVDARQAVVDVIKSAKPTATPLLTPTTTDSADE